MEVSEEIRDYLVRREHDLTFDSYVSVFSQSERDEVRELLKQIDDPEQ